MCRIDARSPALARENMSVISAASFGCIDRFDAIRNCDSVGSLTGAVAEAGAAIAEASGTRRSGATGLSPSFRRTSAGVPG